MPPPGRHRPPLPNPPPLDSSSPLREASAGPLLFWTYSLSRPCSQLCPRPKWFTLPRANRCRLGEAKGSFPSRGGSRWSCSYAVSGLWVAASGRPSGSERGKGGHLCPQGSTAICGPFCSWRLRSPCPACGACKAFCQRPGMSESGGMRVGGGRGGEPTGQG